MKTPKQLREERAALAVRIREMADKVNGENRDFTAEEKPNWEQLNKDYDALSRQIEIAERAKTITDEQGSRDGGTKPGREDRGQGDRDRDEGGGRRSGEDTPVTEETRARAMQAWCRYQMEMDLSEEHLEACRATGLNPQRRNLEFNLPTTGGTRALQRALRGVHPGQAERALSAVTLGDGGATVPQGFVRNLEVALLEFGGIRQVAEILRTDGGEDMPWPTANDTGNKGRRLAEGEEAKSDKSEIADPTFGRVLFGAYKYTSDVVLMPTELLQDSAFDLVTWLGGALGERLGRITADENTTGTGVGMPNGIVTASTLGVTAAAVNAFTADEILNLIHSVDPAYRARGCFCMHDAVILKVRQLKDGTGRYLWTSGMDAGQADRVWGYPLNVNQSMASTVEASAKVMIFGDCSKFKIREVRGIRLYRLEERYREKDYDGFVAFFRQDADLIDAGTHPVKHLKMHA
jgi:HK97 family phage major capsid protein